MNRFEAHARAAEARRQRQDLAADKLPRTPRQATAPPPEALPTVELHQVIQPIRPPRAEPIRCNLVMPGGETCQRLAVEAVSITSPRCADHTAAAAEAKPKRQARPKPETTATPSAALTELDSAVEALVRQHTSGAVIDAAWAAAHRLFQPRL
jgi:hypothetical protein